MIRRVPLGAALLAMTALVLGCAGPTAESGAGAPTVDVPDVSPAPLGPPPLRAAELRFRLSPRACAATPGPWPASIALIGPDGRDLSAVRGLSARTSAGLALPVVATEDPERWEVSLDALPAGVHRIEIAAETSERLPLGARVVVRGGAALPVDEAISGALGELLADDDMPTFRAALAIARSLGPRATPALVAALDGMLDPPGATLDVSRALELIAALEGLDDPRAVGVLRRIRRQLGPAGPCLRGGRLCRGDRAAHPPDPGRSRVWAAAVGALARQVDACPLGSVVIHGSLALTCLRPSRLWTTVELGEGFVPSEHGLLYSKAARAVAVVGRRGLPPAPLEVVIAPIDGGEPWRVRILMHPDAPGDEPIETEVKGKRIIVTLPRDTAAVRLSRPPRNRGAPSDAPLVVRSRRCRKEPRACQAPSATPPR